MARDSKPRDPSRGSRTTRPGPAHGGKPHAPGGKPHAQGAVKGPRPGPNRPRRDKAAEAPVRSPDAPIRIAKAMARAGLCSRRDAERWIADGRVSVNGKRLDTPAVEIGPTDTVLVDGQALPAAEPARLWRYHKPRGLVTTHADPEGRPTVFDNLPPDLPRVISIGRLDFNTEGLLLLTNDGALARHLELPTTGWLRRYRVRAHGRVNQTDLDRIKDGIEIDGVRYGPIEATLDSIQGANIWLTMAIREGKNREVRRILEHLDLTVNRLIRISYGPFQLLDLLPGTADPVKRRVLADQLGTALADEFQLSGADPEMVDPRARAKASERRELAATEAAGERPTGRSRQVPHIRRGPKQDAAGGREAFGKAGGAHQGLSRGQRPGALAGPGSGSKPAHRNAAHGNTRGLESKFGSKSDTRSGTRTSGRVDDRRGAPRDETTTSQGGGAHDDVRGYRPAESNVDRGGDRTDRGERGHRHHGSAERARGAARATASPPFNDRDGRSQEPRLGRREDRSDTRGQSGPPHRGGKPPRGAPSRGGAPQGGAPRPSGRRRAKYASDEQRDARDVGARDQRGPRDAGVRRNAAAGDTEQRHNHREGRRPGDGPRPWNAARNRDDGRPSGRPGAHRPGSDRTGSDRGSRNETGPRDGSGPRPRSGGSAGPGRGRSAAPGFSHAPNRERSSGTRDRDQDRSVGGSDTPARARSPKSKMGNTVRTGGEKPMRSHHGKRPSAGGPSGTGGKRGPGGPRPQRSSEPRGPRPGKPKAP
ncbi:MAG: pseudouridine synthase [Hyphomicrobiaceae bacterium]|nr:pseudouridine synthase [Hyphomicrobiaceae bacterium]